MSVYALNAKNIAPSEYEGLTLLALVEHNGALYGITATELLEFTGSDDTGTDIDCYIQTGKISLGFDETRYTRAYVKDQYANALTLTTFIDSVDAEEEASEQSVSYSVPGKVGARQHARTVRLRSDVKGTSWAWKLANVSGGGMKLKGFTVLSSEIEVDA